MTDKTLDPCGSDSSTELGFLPPYKYGEECGKLERVWTEHDMHAFAAQRVAAERKRWQQAAKAVIESHDAALTYVYERLRSQGVGSITIPDSAVAEIRAVNALRELVQPNTNSGTNTVG